MESAILVDGPYLVLALRALKARVDFGRIAKALHQQYTPVTRATYYDYGEKGNTSRVRKVAAHGFDLWLRPLRRKSPAGSLKDLDVQIAADMLTMSESCDRIVLVSGDIDLVPPVETLKRRGVPVHVVGLMPVIARKLRRAAGLLVDLLPILMNAAAQPQSTKRPMAPPSKVESDLLALKGFSPQHQKDLTATWMGVLLERKLRELCGKHNLQESAADGLDSLNNRLTKTGVYPKLIQKRITVFAEIRNSAVHGHFQNYTATDVAEMEEWVMKFIAGQLL